MTRTPDTPVLRSGGVQLFDALPAAVEAALRESIKRFGVLVPVVKDQHGNLLDGHHRSRIANEENVKYRVDTVRVADEDEARQIALTLNADRRQLDPEQRRQIVGVLREAGHSTTAIAGAVGVNQSTVVRDLQAMQPHNVPAEVTGQDGKKYPAKRPTVVIGRHERDHERAQEALSDIADAPAGPIDIKRAERIAREQAAEQRRSEPVESATQVDDIEIRHGDLRDCLNDLAGQVDAIITDPPYPAEFIEEFDALGTLANKLLKPEGLLIAMVGQSHLPAYIERLTRHLTYRWCGAYLTDGPATRVHGRSVGTKWKPLLIFGGSEFITQDVFQSGADDKRHHHWGQSESGMADIVSRLTAPGVLVVDPFLGGGTTAIVCRDLGRRFVGCDIDAGAVATARERMAL